MTGVVRPALLQRLQKEHEPHVVSDRPRLWASEAGGCARKAMLRIQGYPRTHEYPLQAKESMQNGVMSEHDTELALRAAYGERLQTQFFLGNAQWSCKADFVIDAQSEQPVIIEHKAQGEKWWNYQGSIPKASHIIQIMLYRHLYREMQGVTPQLVLFYRSWGHYAELEITPVDVQDGLTRVQATGEMDGEPYSKVIAVEPETLRLQLEHYYIADILPDPFPNRVEGLCTFKGQPSCPMYGHCWSS